MFSLFCSVLFTGGVFSLFCSVLFPGGVFSLFCCAGSDPAAGQTGHLRALSVGVQLLDDGAASDVIGAGYLPAVRRDGLRVRHSGHHTQQPGDALSLPAGGEAPTGPPVGTGY